MSASGVYVGFKSNMSTRGEGDFVWSLLFIQLMLPLSLCWSLGLSTPLDAGPCGFLGVGSSAPRNRAWKFLMIAIQHTGSELNTLVSPTSPSNLHGCT